jgi:hypothetical protein
MVKSGVVWAVLKPEQTRSSDHGTSRITTAGESGLERIRVENNEPDDGVEFATQ